MVPCEKSKIVSFGSSIMKSNILSPGGSRFPVKLIFSLGSFGLN